MNGEGIAAGLSSIVAVRHADDTDKMNRVDDDTVDECCKADAIGQLSRVFRVPRDLAVVDLWTGQSPTTPPDWIKQQVTIWLCYRHTRYHF